jgi:hypothetical protein
MGFLPDWGKPKVPAGILGGLARGVIISEKVPEGLSDQISIPRA